MLGEFALHHGPCNVLALRVTPHAGDLDVALRAAVHDVVEQARAAGLTMTTPAREPSTATTRPAAAGRATPVAPNPREGMLAADGEGGFTRVVAGTPTPIEVPATQAVGLAALLGLRDTVVTLLDLKASERTDTPAIRAQRGELTARYEAYLGEFGPLVRYTLRPTGRVDAAGEPRHARFYPRQSGLRTDPYASAVYARESDYDPAATDASGGPGASLVRADIFSRQVTAPGTRAQSPADALAICLDEHAHAHVDLDLDLDPD